MTDMTTSLNTPTAEQTKALEMFSKALVLLSTSFGLKVDTLPVKGKRGSRKSKAASSEDGSEPKTKRVLGDKIATLNKERMTVFTEMRQAWLARFPQFSEQATAAWAEGASASVKKTLLDAVKAAGSERCPTYPEALQEHSKRRAASDPEAAAKHAAYRAKVESEQAEKRSTTSKSDDASSVASTPAAPADAEKPKAKRGPKPKSAEEKAAAKVARDAKKAEAKSAPAPPPAPVAEPSVTIVTADADDEEAFKTWSHKGTDYFKNGLNFVYKKTTKGGFGDYVGLYDPLKRAIDSSVPEPEADDE